MEFWPAYFIFLLETVQTALTGADLYYWFVEGFGKLHYLLDSHFSPIDGMAINVPILLTVQGFYIYRIWTLNKRWWWLCVIIIIVRMFLFRRLTYPPCLKSFLWSFLYYKPSQLQRVGLLWVVPSSTFVTTTNVERRRLRFMNSRLRGRFYSYDIKLSHYAGLLIDRNLRCGFLWAHWRIFWSQ
jgi:hypothetical protein